MALMNTLKAISEEDMDWIHGASLKILEETGVIFHSEEALAICNKYGAKVSGQTVYFPKAMVNQALEISPETYRWCARNDLHSVTVGDKKERLLLQPNGGRYSYKTLTGVAGRPSWKILPILSKFVRPAMMSGWQGHFRSSRVTWGRKKNICNKNVGLSCSSARSTIHWWSLSNFWFLLTGKREKHE